MNISLNNDEILILKKAMIHEKKFILYPYIDYQNKSISPNTSVEILSDLRECCSEYLLAIGFDENYQPNNIGIILENLIDKFFYHIEKQRTTPNG